MKVIYKDEEYVVKKVSYSSNDRLALSMEQGGIPAAFPSVNLIDENVDEGWVFLDEPNMSGIYEALKDAKIVSKTVYWGSSGFNRGKYPLVKYLGE